MDARITTPTQRAGLKFRDEPYWKKLGHGAIGFRKRENGVEAWVAKWVTDDLISSGKRRKAVQKVLETVLEIPEYKEAEKLANAWFTQCRGGVIRSGTVEYGCAEYVKNQLSEKGKKPARSSELKFEQLVNGTAFGRIKLDELTTGDIAKWRDSLVTPERQKNSANRVLRSFKAAMNFAFQRGMCPSDAAWRRVKPLKGTGSADSQRSAHLTQAQRKALIAKCGDELANFVRALLYTAARPNEMQDAKKRDFDAKQGTLRLVSLKGTGTERDRTVPLSKAANDFFKEVSKDKLPEAPLLSYEGQRWARHIWAEEIRDAVKDANEKIEGDKIPTDTVAYTMRHCAITDWLSAGINVAAVAKIAGTSIGMIQKNYFKFIATDVSEKLGQITAF